ncbi:MAG: phytanoyl-CoA dioxygenase family protein [Planctomycetes bacterium]|nr:phytanoyl-CoA dioxygenase family protein [Planctomycetota bacterium]
MTATLTKLDVDTPYALKAEQIAFFREEGYIKLKDAVAPEVLEHYGREITRKVKELNTQHAPMEQRSTYQKAFLQIMNIWTKSEVVKEFVFGKRLARIAADLLGTSGVRLYHDQALYKEPGGGLTPWHADQYYWPLATPLTVTAWIPLQATPIELGPLSFAAKSQRFKHGRGVSEISDESERELARMLRERNFELVEEPFDLGEVSFHYGWTFHRAAANVSDRAREVMTIIYMDQDMRVAEPQNKNQRHDLEGWLPGLKPGDLAASPLNPVIFTRE